MKVIEIIQAYFGGDGAARLGQVAGLDAQTSQKVLNYGLPLQLDALAIHAETKQGQDQIVDAIQNLPKFGSIQSALAEPGGAANLQRAGELLEPVLLNSKAPTIASTTTQQAGAALNGTSKLLQMSLPLLLSLLGQRGLNGNNIGTVMAELKGGTNILGGLLGAAGVVGAAGLAGAANLANKAGDLGSAGLGAATGAVTGAANAVGNLGSAGLAGAANLANKAGDLGSAGLGAATGAVTGLTGAASGLAGKAGAGLTGALGAAGAGLSGVLGGGALTSDSLIGFLKEQFSGLNGDKIGTAAGFTGSTAGRATQAALPIVLGAIANKGKTEAGANDVLNLGQQFSGLADPKGNLRVDWLGDSKEVSKVEGLGQSLSTSTFGNFEEITGRLGTALGSSGSNAKKLLSLMLPMVLSLITGQAQAKKVNASGLSGLLGGIGSHLTGMLPSGLGGLAGLLGIGGVAAARSVSHTSTSSTPTPVTTTRPINTSTPASTVTTTTTTIKETEKKRGFPWWLIPLAALLLLGGCYLLKPKNAVSVATQANEFNISDTKLTAGAFTLTGKGKAGEAIEIFEDGVSIGKTIVDADGNWKLDVPKLASGSHTYSIKDASGKEVSTWTTTVEDAVAMAPAVSITEPSADATIPAGGFALGGKGKAGEEYEVFDGDVSLGKTTVDADGNWKLDVPSSSAGIHNMIVKGADGTELATYSANIAAATAAVGATCTDKYTLGMTNGQKVSEPFRFGGKGGGTGYDVTVKRGDRVVGTKTINLDAACGWAYQSKPGVGKVSYEVRPIGKPDSKPLSSLSLIVK